MSSSLARTMVGLIALLVILFAGALAKQPPPDYVVTAIDYHFHDAHPTLPIGPGRDLVVKNEGQNVHNVTITSTGFSQDIKPGQQLRIPDIGKMLGGPGTYSFYCRFHADRGMTGVIVISGS